MGTVFRKQTTRPLCQLSLALVMAFSGCGPGSAEKASITEIEKSGGSLDDDDEREKAPNSEIVNLGGTADGGGEREPVLTVDLRFTEVTDAGLKTLRAPNTTHLEVGGSR